MVEIRLHGALARDYGQVWHLEISTVQEAVDAISRAKKGFKQAIMRLDRMGMVFRVRSKDHDFAGHEAAMSIGTIERIDIIPVLRGASAGLRFVIGAILVISTFIPGSPTFGNAYVMSAGVSLMLGSVAEWLAPTPKKQESGKSLQSWGYQGPSNSAESGQCIPLIFGEVLVGSVPISAGISTARLTPDNSTESIVTIGGRLDNNFMPDFSSPVSYELLFSAATYNMADPITYSWSVTGFALADAKSIVQTGASVKVTLTYSGAQGTSIEDTGTVTVIADGMQTTGDPPGPIQRTTYVNPRVTLSWNDGAGGGGYADGGGFGDGGDGGDGGGGGGEGE